MSELEKKQRDEYQLARKKRIKIQILVAAVLILATLCTLLPCVIMSRNAYVGYAEDGKAETKVYLADNTFYDEEYLGSDYAYVTSLIERMETQFKYGLVMDAAKVDYKYSYTIDATVEVIDKDNAAPLYAPSFVLKEVKDAESSERKLMISETLDIDYAKYNNMAKEYVDSYDLEKVNAFLTVRMTVTVLGKSETFAEDKNNTYTMDVSIPLLKQTAKLKTEASVPTGEQKILACDSTAKTVFLVLWIIFASLSVLMIAFTICFIMLTRDKHIDYARRVQKLLSSYKSYIQRISNEFRFDGYKVLKVMTFEELLEIGDKLQNPVLMYENEDKTRSEFFIATCNDLIYLYVVEVEEDDDELAPAVVFEEPVIVPATVEEPAEDGVEVIDIKWEDDDSTYKYDPNGEVVDKGDIVLVPTTVEDVGEIEKEAEVERGNYRINPDEIHTPLKKIIAVVKRKMQDMVVSSDDSAEE